jgi:hypothetical protein
MKLFMRSLYDKTEKRAEIKNPMKYTAICLRCAGTMGGKMAEKISTWYIDHCDCCGLETSVTQPRDFIWRT